MTAYGTKGRDYTRPCQHCDNWVTVTGSVTGPSECCDECAVLLIAVVYGEPGAEFTPEIRFPLTDAHPVTCGNRTDLPKKERVHDPVYLGTDMRHTGAGGMEELHIYACARCGRDRQTRTPPPWLREKVN